MRQRLCPTGLTRPHSISPSGKRRRAGYRSASNLHAAVRRGRLKTPIVGPLHTRVTTLEWLDEFLAGLRFNTQFRGKPKDALDDD